MGSPYPLPRAIDSWRADERHDNPSNHLTDLRAFLEGGSQHPRQLDPAGSCIVNLPPRRNLAYVHLPGSHRRGNLAREIVAGSAATEPLGALELLELKIVRAGFPEEDDVAAFWTAILELGALAGAAIGASNGGAWFHDATGQGTLPFKYRCFFRGEMATANPLGKALKFVREKGDGEEPSSLVRTLGSSP
ncbi:hypothetical protein [Sorangium sp. So ce233]|uniref:hypothetical protein n=1 Tax=Sorangium sp. So ce233 TaxID=3133290 RepID=UPI003F5EBC96